MLAADPDPLSERCRTSWPFRYGGEQRGPRSWRYNPRAARPKARYLMPRFIRIQSLAVLLALLLAVPTAQISARQEPAVVRAVFFYSPSCGHCQYVISEVFPLLFEQYGDQIEIIGIDVTNPAAQALFQAAIEFYEIPEEVRGSVPLLTVGDTWLIGSRDIPEQFPGIVEAGLAQGGIDWPAIPGLAEAMASAQPETTPALSTSTASTPAPTGTPVPLYLPTRGWRQ